MRVTVVGCGDSFGSGGRLQTCFHVSDGKQNFLIDCGASSMIGLQRQQLDPDAISTIVVSHLHGDHFGGIIWLLLHAQFISQRRAPLVIAGPAGIEARILAASEILFPGSTRARRRFDLSYIEMIAGRMCEINGISGIAAEVSHPSGAPSHALRLASGGRVIGFSGDTEWVGTLPAMALDADLFITECFNNTTTQRYHISWSTLAGKLAQLKARRILLTHMSSEMLAARDQVRARNVIFAEDGLVLDL